LKKTIFSVCILAWGSTVAAGMWMLSAYEFTPGATKTAQVQWPSDSKLARSTTRPTLLIFVHPQCPCSRASAAELSRTMARQAERVSVVAVVYTTAVADEHWLESATMDQLRSIPGITLIEDKNALEARRFNAITSGELLLYDRSGALRYHGGITASRSHEGANAAQDALEARIENPSLPLVSLPTFGCAIVTSETGTVNSGGS
jgi:hypothetical protein